MQASSISNVSPVNASIPSDVKASSAAPQLFSSFFTVFQTKLNAAGVAAKFPQVGKPAPAGLAAPGGPAATTGSPKDSAYETDCTKKMPPPPIGPNVTICHAAFAAFPLPAPVSPVGDIRPWTLPEGVEADHPESDTATFAVTNASGIEALSQNLPATAEGIQLNDSDSKLPPVGALDLKRSGGRMADAISVSAGPQNLDTAQPDGPNHSTSVPVPLVQTPLPNPNFALQSQDVTPKQAAPSNRLPNQPSEQKYNSIQPRADIHIPVPHAANSPLTNAINCAQPSEAHLAGLPQMTAACLDVSLPAPRIPVSMDARPATAGARPEIPVFSAKNAVPQSSSQPSTSEQPASQQTGGLAAIASETFAQAGARATVIGTPELRSQENLPLQTTSPAHPAPNGGPQSDSPQSARLSVSTQQPDARQSPSLRSALQQPADFPATVSGAVAQTAARTAAIGGSLHRLQDNIPAHTTSQAQPVPSAASAAKPAIKGSSNDSRGNDANAKTDQGSTGPAVRMDEKPFTVPLDTAPVKTGTSSELVSTSSPVSPSILAPTESQSGKPGIGASSNSQSTSPQNLPSPAAPGGASVVSEARILDRSGQTEIRIEMQDHSLGGIELRAHIVGDQIGASIAVEHHDAQVMLTSELPALHTALNEKNLRVDIHSVSQGSMTSMNGGQGGESAYKGFSQTHPKSSYPAQAEAPIAFRDAQTESAERGNSTAGLSVRA